MSTPSDCNEIIIRRKRLGEINRRGLTLRTHLKYNTSLLTNYSKFIDVGVKLRKF